MEKVRDFIFLGYKITADGDYSHEIKRCLLFRRQAMTDLDGVLKSRDIALLTKVSIIKAMNFLIVVWMWQLDRKGSWAPKNWCFQTVVLEKTLESPLDSKEIKTVNPKGWLSLSLSKAIIPEYSLEGLMLKLKLQYFDHLMWTTDSLEKTLMLGMIEGKRRRGWQRMRWLDGITNSIDTNLGKV